MFAHLRDNGGLGQSTASHRDIQGDDTTSRKCFGNTFAGVTTSFTDADIVILDVKYLIGGEGVTLHVGFGVGDDTT